MDWSAINFWCSHGKEAITAEESPACRHQGQVRLPYLQVSMWHSARQTLSLNVYDRARKVKCDQARPACQRCMSTGRTCDGYGIWGGGGKPPGQQTSDLTCQNSTFLSRSPQAIMVGLDEQSSLDWFRCKTAVKLPGIFRSPFWDTLIYQVMAQEPALRSAVVALGLVHKSELVYGSRLGSQETIPDEHERAMLGHYGKAITFVQSHCSIQDKASNRLILVACIIFVYLELLRGRYRTAQAHLRNGVNVLQGMICATTSALSRPNSVTLGRNACDDWIAEALFSLRTRAALLNPQAQNLYAAMHLFEAKLPVTCFASFNHAKLHLDRIIDDIMILGEDSRKKGVLDHAMCIAPLRDRQEHLVSEIKLWLTLYDSSRQDLLAGIRLRNEFTYRLLRNYHSMACVMAKTCLGAWQEPILKCCTEEFVAIVERSIFLRNMVFKTSIVQKMYGHDPEEGRSVVEMGWIPPLYFVALFCRKHRVRLHAIRLLESSQHREGPWISPVAAAVARKVMQLEERGNNYDANDAFDLEEIPKDQDLTSSDLPQDDWITHVQVSLPDDPGGDICLSYKQQNDSGEWAIKREAYTIHINRWRTL